MKKIILLISITLAPITLKSCPQCVDYAGQRFSKTPFTKIDCSCPCQNYARSNLENGNRCQSCGHRMLPRTIYQKQEEEEALLRLLLAHTQKNKPSI